MRASLPLRPALLRTPACPGFGVSGDRKRACFDRSCCWGAISPQRGLLALSCGWGFVDMDGAAHREPALGRLFERVQMGVAGVVQILEALAAVRRRPLPIERVQMDCGLEEARPWQPYPLGSFERVQMAPAFAVFGGGERPGHRGLDRQGQRRSVAAWPSRLLRLNSVSPTQIITWRASMPPLK